MLSSYRLGDLVSLSLNESEVKEILKEHPDSFGSKFIIEMCKNPSLNNIDTMIKIVLDNIEKYSKFLPKDISESTVIHLRLGDVIAGTESHELLKRPFSIVIFRILF